MLLGAIIGLSLLDAIIYEIMKGREEATAERAKEDAKIAERNEVSEMAPA
jgi:hypothetical protein